MDDEYITVTNFPIQGKNYIPNNELTAKGFKGISTIWKNRYAHDGESSFDYRPVTSTSFAVEYGIFGQNPFISHLINILLYAVTICVLFCVLLKLFESYQNKLIISCLTSFIFLIQPIHTEVVNNLKSRDELLSFLFPLISLWYCLKTYDKITMKNMILIFVFFVLGMYSKRTGLIFIGIIPLSLILFRKINLKKTYYALIFIFAFVTLNSLLKKQVLSEKLLRTFYHFENPIFTDHFTFGEKIMASIKCIGFYIKFLLIPYPFRAYYGTNVIDISFKADIYFFVSLLFIIGLMFYYYKTKNKILLFGMLLFLGGIIPFSNLGPPVAGIIGERLAYNASLGFSVILSMLLMPLFKSSNTIALKYILKKPVVYFTPFILVYFILIWNRNTNWKDKITLFEHDIKYLEVSAKANSILANEYFQILNSGNPKYNSQIIIQKALDHYKKTINIDSSFYSAYNNAGVIYYTYFHDLPTAKQYFKLAIRYRPNYPQAYENLGNCYKDGHEFLKADICYKKAIQQNPLQYTAYAASIKMFYEDKQYAKALFIIRLAAKKFPDNYSLIGQEADCLFMLGEIPNALEKYNEAYKVFPNHQLAAYLSQKYLEYGDSVKYNFYKTK